MAETMMATYHHRVPDRSMLLSTHFFQLVFFNKITIRNSTNPTRLDEPEQRLISGFFGFFFVHLLSDNLLYTIATNKDVILCGASIGKLQQETVAFGSIVSIENKTHTKVG